MNVVYFNANGQQHIVREYMNEDLFSGIKSLFDANKNVYESQVLALEDAIDELKEELGDK